MLIQNKLIVYFLVIICAIFGAAGQILFKMASDNLKFNLTIFLNIHLLVGLLLYAVATILFVYLLQFGDVSKLYPLIATSYIWVLLLAKIVLNENINCYQIVGVTCIIIGVYFIAK
jgi:drug/metabolite transporter (DMT)-like permease